MAYLTYYKKAFRNINYESIMQWENDYKILHLLHLFLLHNCGAILSVEVRKPSGIIKFECLGYYRRQRMRSVLHASFYFCYEEHP